MLAIKHVNVSWDIDGHNLSKRQAVSTAWISTYLLEFGEVDTDLGAKHDRVSRDVIMHTSNRLLLIEVLTALQVI